MKELETLLLEQDYPKRIVKAGINKALKIPQNELRNVKEQENKILPLICIQTTPEPDLLLNKPWKTSKLRIGWETH